MNLLFSKRAQIVRPIFAANNVTVKCYSFAYLCSVSLTEVENARKNTFMTYLVHHTHWFDLLPGSHKGKLSCSEF